MARDIQELPGELNRIAVEFGFVNALYVARPRGAATLLWCLTGDGADGFAIEVQNICAELVEARRAKIAADEALNRAAAESAVPADVEPGA